MNKYDFKKPISKNRQDEEIELLTASRCYDGAPLSWHNIDVFISKQKSTLNFWSSTNTSRLDDSKKILRHVNGTARSNQLLAILGASAAGKTTMINVLTKRTASNLMVDGKVQLYGNSISKEALQQISAYVQQDYLFIASLTCREHLIFQALMRMERKITNKERMKRLEEVICEFGLSNCADTIIGNPGLSVGISGGEKKRLALATEALTNPLIMFCDEPTSGLDSFMAQHVITVLKEFAAKGKIVIITIHQPSSEVFAMFDRILLMAEGRVAFLGTKDAAYEFFKTEGFECPVSFNPAEFFISTLAIIPGMENESRKRIEAICDHFDTCSSDEGIAIKDEHANTYQEEFDDLWTEDANKKYQANAWTQFRALMWRSTLTVMRETAVLKARFIQPLFVAIWIGIMFFGQKLNQEGVMNINGAIFLLLTEMTFHNVFGVIHVFCLELPVFHREYGNGMYGTGAYFLAKTMTETPLFALIAVFFTTLTYWTTGLNPGILQFVIACGTVILVTQCACSFGFMMSTCCASISLALSNAGALVTPLMFFGGYYLNHKSFPNWLAWMEYFSWYRYSNEALLINQWQDIYYIECNLQRNQTCFQNGGEVLESLNFSPNNFSYDIIFLVAQLVAYRFVAYLALSIRVQYARN